MANTFPQDKCSSSESVTDGKYLHDIKEAALFWGNSQTSIDTSSAEINLPMFPYPYMDNYYMDALFAAYEPPMITAAVYGRVPLPTDLRNGGPIYVNAKQYHGILRRRRSRAKLEARCKLIKRKKPYLHESRHRHAMSRVRGAGGRFISTKEHQSLNSNDHQQLEVGLKSFYSLQTIGGANVHVAEHQHSTERSLQGASNGFMYNGN